MLRVYIARFQTHKARPESIGAGRAAGGVAADSPRPGESRSHPIPMARPFKAYAAPREQAPRPCLVAKNFEKSIL